MREVVVPDVGELAEAVRTAVRQVGVTVGFGQFQHTVLSALPVARGAGTKNALAGRQRSQAEGDALQPPVVKYYEYRAMKPFFDKMGRKA